MLHFDPPFHRISRLRAVLESHVLDCVLDGGSASRTLAPDKGKLATLEKVAIAIDGDQQ